MSTKKISFLLLCNNYTIRKSDRNESRLRVFKGASERLARELALSQQTETVPRNLTFSQQTATAWLGEAECLVSFV